MHVDEYRRIALSMPDAEERAHMGHPDFRVRGKIFATIWPDENWGMVKLTPEQQREFMLADASVFSPVPGKWGEGGATRVQLAAASEPIVREAMTAAWKNAAPGKRSARR